MSQSKTSEVVLGKLAPVDKELMDVGMRFLESTNRIACSIAARPLGKHSDKVMVVSVSLFQTEAESAAYFKAVRALMEKHLSEPF